MKYSFQKCNLNKEVREITTYLKEKFNRSYTLHLLVENLVMNLLRKQIKLFP